MNITESIALGVFILSVTALVFYLTLLNVAKDSKNEMPGGQELEPCSGGGHTWRVWIMGCDPDEYYYCCNRCGWFALRGEVELGALDDAGDGSGHAFSHTVG